MKSRIGVLIVFSAAFASAAADAHGRRYETVRVVGVEPIYQTILVERPVRRCSTDIVERRVANPSVAGQTLAGAVIGAAIGRQFGDGSGRDALTVIGAVAGSAVANDRASRRHGVTIVNEPVRRCTTEYRRLRERHVTGYWVDYRHRGRIYRVHRLDPPGSRIRILVGS
jgi:uncharacterized protein YcfJ